MTQAVTSHDRYLADFKNLPPEGPPWLRRLRAGAIARFQELGFPTARRSNEPWKYTNVGPIAEREFAYPFGDAALVSVDDLRAIAACDDSWNTLVFINGRHAPALSSRLETPRRGVSSLASALESDADLTEGHLAQHASFEDDAFIALNTGFLHDGAFVHVPDGQSIPATVHLLYVSTDGSAPSVSYPRTLIVAGANSRATVIESYVSVGSARSFTNAVTEIVVEDGAQVQHHRLLLESVESFHIGNTRVYLEKDSSFSSISFAAGAAIGRNDFRVLLDAPGASCSLNGLYVTTGTQHIDNNMNIDHAKPHTTSRLYYKGILDGKSKAVFGGLVLVRPGADKTDSYQQDKNLVLSDEAEVDSKPSLEIYADDVKCGHGATAGAVAEDAIFYMRSRGLDEETANNLLIKGFASEILDTIQIEPLRVDLERRAMTALWRHSDVARAGLKPAPTEGSS